MAEGIRKRHSKGCSARAGGRCNCNAGWEASIFLAREGKRITKTFPRKAEARSWRAEAKRAADKGALRAAPQGARTLAVALRQFVTGMQEGTVRPKGRKRYKPNTIRSYERALRVHIAPSALGGVKVADVRRSDLQALADDLLTSELSAGTVGNVLNPIQAFYRRAVDRDELNYNPSERIDIPDGRSTRPKRIASREEAVALLDSLDVEDRAVWATAFFAGLRRGELQALRVCDIDFEANVIAVERGWDQVEGVIDPKSVAGRRTIPLLAILRDHLAGDLQRTGRGGEDLVFGRTTEQAFYASTVDYRAKRAWRVVNQRATERAGRVGGAADLLQPITLHGCRHTFASLLIDAGANPKAIQQFMGHSRIQTTFDVYGHLLPGSHDDVRQRMNAYLEVGSTPDM
ncbi:MAG TPA: site-specific integrase [Solirubrobacterales bacterium]|nr:site-specific integrase [Solirubrobacterales bacterium]